MLLFTKTLRYQNAGTKLGHWANAVLIGVPANGVKPTVTYDEVAPGGALSQALGTIAAGVLHRAKPGYLSSMVASSYFGGFDDDANEARRMFEATAPNPVTVAQQVNELGGGFSRALHGAYTVFFCPHFRYLKCLVKIGMFTSTFLKQPPG